MISGCCFMFHFRLLEKIGMWDENIYLNHEEDAIAAKLYALGLQCAVVPRATLIHLGSQTIGSITPFQYYHRYISEIYVLRKYYNASSLQLFLLKIIDNIALWKNISDKEIRKGYRKAFNEYYKTELMIYKQELFISIIESYKGIGYLLQTILMIIFIELLVGTLHISKNWIICLQVYCQLYFTNNYI